MPDRLTSQATFLSYPVISAGKMTHGFLPTCVQTNQLWPEDSRSYHICESETTFLGAPLWPTHLVAYAGHGSRGLPAAGVLSISNTFALAVYYHGATPEVLLS